MSDASTTSRRFVVGVSGASGAVYVQRIVRTILGAGHQVHLTVTDPGRRLLRDELGLARLHHLAGVPDGADPADHGLFLHPVRDIGAPIASGSFLHHGMIVAPCSAHTCNAIASGLGDNLLTRAAAVTLKEQRPLILLLREAPLTAIDLEQMLRLARAGAVVCPASPGFYLAPKTLDDIVDFVAAKALDLLGVAHDLSARWSGAVPKPAPAPDAQA